MRSADWYTRKLTGDNRAIWIDVWRSYSNRRKWWLSIGLWFVAIIRAPKPY